MVYKKQRSTKAKRAPAPKGKRSNHLITSSLHGCQQRSHFPQDSPVHNTDPYQSAFMFAKLCMCNFFIRQIDISEESFSITCIPIPGSMLYMCAVLDLCGKAVLAWTIGSDTSSSLVTDTIREALKQKKVTGGLAFHSHQGSQYTSQAYFDLTQEYHVSPSMSNPGCPYDNAAMEKFFGTLKTECLYRAHFASRSEVEQLVSESIDFYNFESISLKNGLTPVKIRGKAA